jgi:hypothetical protein
MSWTYYFLYATAEGGDAVLNIGRTVTHDHPIGMQVVFGDPFPAYHPTLRGSSMFGTNHHQMTPYVGITNSRTVISTLYGLFDVNQCVLATWQAGSPVRAPALRDSATGYTPQRWQNFGHVLD